MLQLDMLSEPTLSHRERAKLKRALKHELKQRRAELHQWADAMLHLDVLRSLWDGVNESAVILIDGSGPPRDYRQRVMRALDVADPISNADLLRAAVRAGHAAPETAAELRRRTDECLQLVRRLRVVTVREAARRRDAA
jgi:hypothetical protein